MEMPGTTALLWVLFGLGQCMCVCWGGGRGAQLLTPAKWVSACVNEGQSSPGRLMYSKTNPPS